MPRRGHLTFLSHPLHLPIAFFSDRNISTCQGLHLSPKRGRSQHTEFSHMEFELRCFLKGGRWVHLPGDTDCPSLFADYSEQESVMVIPTKSVPCRISFSLNQLGNMRPCFMLVLQGQPVPDAGNNCIGSN